MLVYVVDGVAASESDYETLVHRLGFELQFFTSSNQLMAAAWFARPTCLILDLDCEQRHGGNVLPWLLDQGIEVPVILTTTDAGSQDAITGMRLGALALLGRPVSPCLLEEYLVFAASRLRTHLKWKQRHAQLESVFSSLTERQQRVLDYAACGMLNKTIASRLNVSKRTVEAERSKVLKAFAADSFYDVSMRMGEYGVLDELQRLRKQEALLRIRSDATVTEHALGESVCGR
jgi:FixJ family two-component response regulator